MYFQSTVFQNGESQVSASHSYMFMNKAQTWVWGISLQANSEGKMLSDIQTDSRPWLQKPNIGEINSIYVPWILALPDLFKGNQTCKQQSMGELSAQKAQGKNSSKALLKTCDINSRAVLAFLQFQLLFS